MKAKDKIVFQRCLLVFLFIIIICQSFFINFCINQLDVRQNLLNRQNEFIHELIDR